MSRISTQSQVDAAERTLRLTWVIVFGAVLYSVLTVTPLVQRVTTDGWDWTGPILPIVVDAAVVIVVRVDSIIARLGGRAGGWSAVLRWLTGAMTLALNVGDSALKGDLVGVGVHVVAPALLIVTAEASLAYRRAITAAVARIAEEEADAHERSRREQKEREDRQAEERRAEREEEERREERAERRAREEREHAALIARQEREDAAKIARQEREDARQAAREDEERKQRAEAARLAREQEDRRREQERRRREQEDRQAREKQQREARRAAEKAEAERIAAEEAPLRERLVRAHDGIVSDQLPEPDARRLILLGLGEGASQRQLAAACGWSAGWVANRCKEVREDGAAAELIGAAA